MPTSRWIRLSSTCICSRKFLSSAPSGSSSSSTSGLNTRPRASATRCCWPPDSSRGYLWANRCKPTSSSIRSACALISCFGKPRILSGNSTLFAAVNVRKQGIVLENHADIASVEFDGAAGRRLESRDHQQRRRLAGAAGAQQSDEFAALDVDRDIIDGV